MLNLLRGTLRTFTGLIAATNRDKFAMKTRVATVGIRGSGNILYACDGQGLRREREPGDATGDTPITVNHTIEGSHAVDQHRRSDHPGTTQTLITGPGQTVLVAGSAPPRFIPTPQFIANSATNMTNAKPAAAATPAGDGRDAQLLAERRAGAAGVAAAEHAAS